MLSPKFRSYKYPGRFNGVKDMSAASVLEDADTYAGTCSAQIPVPRIRLGDKAPPTTAQERCEMPPQ